MEEPVFDENNAPPVAPPSPGPLKRSCVKCGYKYLLTELQPYLIEKFQELYHRIIELYKDEKWLKNMKVRDRKEDDDIKVKFFGHSVTKMRLSRLEIFCELCWNQVN